MPEYTVESEKWTWKNFRQDIAGSIRGIEYDFTTGSIGRAILLLSIPMVLEMLMESIFAVVDIFFVSRLGSEAVATVGVTEAMLTVIYAIAMGMSMATTAIVSRRIGEKNQKAASVAGVQAILAGILMSLPVSLLGILFSKELLALMGTSSEIVETLFTYTTIMLGGNYVIMLLFIVNAVFRGAGDAAISMRVLWVANLINIVLDPLLIFGVGPFPELGLTGAAVATTIGRGLGVLYQFYLLKRPGRRIHIRYSHLKIEPVVMKKLFRLSLGGMAQLLIATASWIGLIRIMANFGSEALAGYTIAIRIIIFSILPSEGMSNAAATLMGQNLGAGQPGRAERSVWISAMVNTLFLVLVGILLFTFSVPLVRLFTAESAVIGIGAQCLRIVSFGYLFYACGMVMSQAFNGAGDTVTPTILNFICFWLIEIPVAYILSLTLNMESQGVFLAIVIAESMLGVLGVLVFRKGGWKTQVV